MLDNRLTMSNSIYRKRRIIDQIMKKIALLTLLFGLFWLFWIVLTLLVRGSSSFSYTLFTETTPPPGQNGGLLNAIMGSILIVGTGILIGAPIGILAGTYLAEYNQRDWLVPVIRFLNDLLLSTPSIIVGLFTYAVYVAQVRHYSGWAGALSLSILVIPIVTRTTDNILTLVPNNLREAAFALGCPKWRMVLAICYRAARTGIATGVLLSLARISGETAPLLFTALSNQFISFNMNGPMANLPVIIYQYAASPFKDWNDLAWAGAALITLLVLIVNISVRNLFGNQ